MQTTSPKDQWSKILAASVRVDWKIRDILDEDTRFDFSKPFLPNALVGTKELTFLSDEERHALGHIRAHGYLGTFGIVEEWILPFVVEHAKAMGPSDAPEVRALLRFAAEEAKHIELFRVFRARFERDFGHPCALVGPADEFARAVLAHAPLSVSLAVLHIEWMTQRHWLESVRSDETLDPAFKRLLKYHWLEEAQHARLDTLLTLHLAARSRPEEITEGIDGYASILRLIDGALSAQVDLDLATLQSVSGRALSAEHERHVKNVQLRSMRRAFLVSGLTHPELVKTIRTIAPAALSSIQDLANEYDQ